MTISLANRTLCGKYAQAIEPLVDAAGLSQEQRVVATAVVNNTVHDVTQNKGKSDPEPNVSLLQDNLCKLGLEDSLSAQVILGAGRSAAAMIPPFTPSR